MKTKWIIPVCIALMVSLLGSCVPKRSIPERSTPSPTPDEVQPPPEGFFPDLTSGKIPVIYSHGGGPCDIGGMVFFATHPNVDLVGLVFTRGEIHPEIALGKWSTFLYDVLGSRGTAVALGSQVRLDENPHEFPEEWRGSADDFWGLELAEASTTFEPRSGPEMIVDLVNHSPEKVTIVGMASMVDLALALQQDPEIIHNIAQVVIMGGAFNVPGNLAEGPETTNNTVAEWNIYIDAEAARVLFNSGVPLSIVPLDAIQYLVKPEDVRVMNTIDDPRVAYVARMWNQQLDWSQDSGFLIWDTITATAVTNPENFHWTYDGVDVVTAPGDTQGQTLALHNGATHTRFATGADYRAIIELLFDTYRGGSAGDLRSNEGQGRETPTQTAETEPRITGLGGRWEGFSGDFHIIFNLGADCSLNEKCGTFEIPEFSLSGEVIFTSIDGNIYPFTVANLSAVVESADYEYLQLLEDGRLLYSSTRAGETAEAVLERK